MRERHLMPIVDDLGLSAVTDRAAVHAARKGLVTGADLMVYLPRAEIALREMQSILGVSVGVHVDLFPKEDPNTNASFAQAFRDSHTRNSTKEGRERLVNHTIDQIKRFQDMAGRNPAHVSTHNHTHLDSRFPGNYVFPEFIEAVLEAVGGEEKTLIRAVNVEQVRHCRAGQLSKGLPPDSPKEFYEKLLGWREVEHPLDLLVHPALPLIPGEEHLGGGYPLEMRIKDLEGLAAIMKNRVPERAGYRLTSPDEYLELQKMQWPDTMWPIDASVLHSLPPELRPSNEDIQELMHPWKLLEDIQKRLHERVVDTRIAEGVEIDDTAKIEGDVWLGPGVKVGPHTTIVGPTVLGGGTIVGNYSTVLHSVIGPHTSFGNNTEISRSVIGKRSVTHGAGFLDSIGGDGIHLATSRTSNQRIDCGEIKVFDGEQQHPTGRDKLGVMMGGFSTYSTYVSSDPGVRIGKETIIGPHTRLSQDVGERVLFETTATQTVHQRRSD